MANVSKALDDARQRRIVELGTILLIAAILAIPASASAGSPACGERKELLMKLGKQFNEAPSAVGISNDGTLIEVLTNEDSSTWTIMVSRPDGLSCLVAAGESWQVVKREARRDLGA